MMRKQFRKFDRWLLSRIPMREVFVNNLLQSKWFEGGLRGVAVLLISFMVLITLLLLVMYAFDDLSLDFLIVYPLGFWTFIVFCGFEFLRIVWKTYYKDMYELNYKCYYHSEGRFVNIFADYGNYFKLRKDAKRFLTTFRMRFWKDLVENGFIINHDDNNKIQLYDAFMFVVKNKLDGETPVCLDWHETASNNLGTLMQVKLRTKQDVYFETKAIRAVASLLHYIVSEREVLDFLVDVWDTDTIDATPVVISTLLLDIIEHNEKYRTEKWN